MPGSDFLGFGIEVPQIHLESAPRGHFLMNLSSQGFGFEDVKSPTNEVFLKMTLRQSPSVAANGIS